MKYITLILLATLLPSCASNKYDAEIAKSKFEYGKEINAQKKVFELVCDQEQKETGKCGIFGEFAVYQPNQRYVDVDPQKKGFMDYSFGLAQILLPSVLQYAIADSNNKYSFKSLESTNNLFSGIFSGVSDLKGAGITYTDSNNDYSTTSTSTNSNNPIDYTYSDSYNTTSGDTLSDSYNTSSVQETSTDTRTSSTQGDTTSTNTTSTTTVTPEETAP